MLSALPTDRCDLRPASHSLHQEDSTPAAGEDCPVFLDGLGNYLCSIHHTQACRLPTIQKSRQLHEDLRRDHGVESDRGVYWYYSRMHSCSQELGGANYEEHWSAIVE